MDRIKSKNPLHGITLEKMVTDLQAKYGWAKLGEEITIKCFTNDPSLKSSLVFLRRTPWARKKVENLYLAVLEDSLPKRKVFQKKTRNNSEEVDKNLWPDLEL